ncbi:MAG: FHA domain-containing protein, partial [Verrucomicrobiae bacterium]|nr:FHA domain-containing protein [Verrucomicrobiae bacterium]
KARVPKLEVRAEADAPPVIHELVGDHYTLGRSSRCDIVVQTPLVSQIHAELVRDSQKRGAGFFLRDKDSTNGIYRQRQKVTAVPLRHNLHRSRCASIPTNPTSASLPWSKARLRSRPVRNTRRVTAIW